MTVLIPQEVMCNGCLCTHRSALIHAVMPGHVDWHKVLNVMQANAAPTNVASNLRVRCADRLLGLVTLKITVQASPPIVQRTCMIRTAPFVTVIRPTAIRESARHTTTNANSTFEQVNVVCVQ